MARQIRDFCRSGAWNKVSQGQRSPIAAIMAQLPVDSFEGRIGDLDEWQAGYQDELAAIAQGRP